MDRIKATTRRDDKHWRETFFGFGAPYTWGLMLSSSYLPSSYFPPPIPTHSKLLHRKIFWFKKNNRYNYFYLWLLRHISYISYILWCIVFVCRDNGISLCISFERTREEAALAGSFFNDEDKQHMSPDVDCNETNANVSCSLHLCWCPLRYSNTWKPIYKRLWKYGVQWYLVKMKCYLRLETNVTFDKHSLLRSQHYEIHCRDYIACHATICQSLLVRLISPAELLKTSIKTSIQSENYPMCSHKRSILYINNAGHCQPLSIRTWSLTVFVP